MNTLLTPTYPTQFPDQPPAQPGIRAGDRLGLTVFFALVIHAILILGISFSPMLAQRESQQQPPLEITLVHQRSDETPEDADYLAQANLAGAGNTQEKTRPSSPAAMLVTDEQRGTASHEQAPAAAHITLSQPHELLTSPQSRQKTPTDEPVDEQQVKAKTAAELIKLSMQIAHLSAEIDTSIKSLSKELRHHYIAANAREYRDAAYLDGWRAKVERIGNLNYPEEAKRRGLSGSLVLDVALNVNGSLRSVNIIRSSGHKILDDAAIRIVRLSAPFAPLPPDMRQDTDVLHIIRGWQFLNNHRLTTSAQ